MDSRLKCHICKKIFTQKSSLVRHSKRCTPGPAPSLRQKSCRQCTSSKTKCDLRRPKCSRCELRDTPCEYVVPMTRGVPVHAPDEETDRVEPNEREHDSTNLALVANIASIGLPRVPPSLISSDSSLDLDPALASFSFANPSGHTKTSMFNVLPEKDVFPSFQWDSPMATEPVPGALTTSTRRYGTAHFMSSDTSTKASDFASDDWLLWNPGPPGATPPLVKHSMETLLRVIRTYPKMLAKGFQTPPILHFTHTSPESILWPMANCLSISKMWADQSDGATDIIRRTIVQEMRSIFEQYRSLDEKHLLAALQALTMYTVILMFPGRGQLSVSLVDPAIFLCLQRVVNYVSKTGLLLTEERDCKRPSWESWIHVTAKRRAVFTLYLLHWSYSVYHGLQSFACSQLGFLPAPAPKFLWQAENKDKWEHLYYQWLVQWGEFPYMMHEFAAILPGTALEPRTEKWLEDADELGVLFFSIVNATDRGSPVYDHGNGIAVLTP